MRTGISKVGWYGAAAVLAALTGLAVIALSYLAGQWLGLPFVPFVLFDWLARVLPGGIITLGIDSMVRVIVAFGLGPIDVIAKSLEQILGMVLWLVLSVVLGLILAAWLQPAAAESATAAERERAGAGRQAGALAGLALALLVVVALFGLRSPAAGQPWALLWLAVLLPGWGAVLGTLLAHFSGVDAAPAVATRVGPPAARQEGAAEAPGALLPPAAAPPSSSAPTPAPPAAAAAEPSRASPASQPARQATIGRRAFLWRAAGGSLVLTVAAAGLGRLFAEDRARTGVSQPLGEAGVNAAPPLTPAPASTASPPPGPGTALGRAGATFSPPPTPTGRHAPAPGERPEITPTTSFYRIDINLVPPKVSGADWQLQVSGLFDRPRNLTLQDLLAMPAVTQPITQSCISNPIGGDLISSAYYTGVRLRDVLADLGLQPAARQLALQGADGFYESVELQDMQDPRVLLVYAMNGVTLPVEHGYPLRIYIPNRYGMKQPKWIISMQAINHDISGYWVDRGWSPEARPQVISIIDTVAKDQAADGRVPVGGIAWAGDRGIRSVEVQVDNGTWDAATLIAPPLGPLTWVQWRYDWPRASGRHTFRVRATDGQGALQSGQDQDTYPNGATGYHTVSVAF